MLAKFLPELDRFPSSEERDAAFKRARVRIGRRPIFSIGPVVLFFIFVAAMLWIRRVLGSLPYLVVSQVAGLSLFLAALAVLSLSLRRGIQRDLRRQLRANGIHICVTCGYELTHHQSDYCPECGSPRRADNGT